MPKKSSKKTPAKFSWDLSKVPPFVVWNRIKSLRVSLGLTQLEVAAGAKISVATVVSLEAGFDVQTLEDTKSKLARYFDVPVEEIFPVSMVGRITKNEYLEKKIAEDKKSVENSSSGA